MGLCLRQWVCLPPQKGWEWTSSVCWKFNCLVGTGLCVDGFVFPVLVFCGIVE